MNKNPRGKYCQDCRMDLTLEPRTMRPRKRCMECRKARQVQWAVDWRSRNLEKVRRQAEERSRRRGHLPRARVIAQRQAKMLERAKPIMDLLAKDYSYSQAASVIGVSKNTAIGLVDRVRKMETRAQ